MLVEASARPPRPPGRDLTDNRRNSSPGHAADPPASELPLCRAGGCYERGAEKQSVCTGEPWHVARPGGAASIVWSPSHQSPAEARRFTRSRRVDRISIEL